jgi:hypothetical protein
MLKDGTFQRWLTCFQGSRYTIDHVESIQTVLESEWFLPRVMKFGSFAYDYTFVLFDPCKGKHNEGFETAPNSLKSHVIAHGDVAHSFSGLPAKHSIPAHRPDVFRVAQ